MQYRGGGNICYALFSWLLALHFDSNIFVKKIIGMNQRIEPPDQSESKNTFCWPIRVTLKCWFNLILFISLLADFPWVHSRISALQGGRLFFTHYSLLPPRRIVEIVKCFFTFQGEIMIKVLGDVSRKGPFIHFITQFKLSKSPV